MTRFNHRHTQAYKDRMKLGKVQFKSRKLTKEPKAKIVRFPIEELNNHKGLIARECPTCHKEFAIYASVAHGTKNIWCSPECYKKGNTKVARYANAVGSQSNGTQKSYVKRILSRKGFFKQHKDEYQDKIIKCSESPTGRAYVGINKTPFMPAAENGHGFQGVLLQDEDREFVQCHSCGKWMQKIATNHLKKCSGLSMAEHKTKYGLNDQGLVSDETSLRLTKACLKNKISARSFKKYAGRNGGRTKPQSMEFFNKFGTCPLQLKTRLYEFIRCNHELPSQGNRGRTIYKALRRRYGSFGHALSAHGLPWMKRQGTTMRFAFPDGTIYKYNINQFHDREELFNMMMQKCPVLSEPLPV
jgi:hypothetical protein